MHPLLLLALLGGGVYVVSKVFGSSGTRVLTVDRRAFVDGRLNRLTEDKVEKFEDPMFATYGTDTPYIISPNRPPGLAFVLNRFTSMALFDKGELVTGYEYLSTVPNNAQSRVAAMRARVQSVGAVAEPARKSDPLTFRWGLFHRSREALRNLSDSLTRTYGMAVATTGAVEQAAAKLGVPTTAITSEAKSFLSSASTSVGSDYAVIDKAITTYGPIARQAVNAISRAIQVGMDGGASAEDKIFSTIDLAADIVLKIPVYGWIIGGAVKTLSWMVRTAIGEEEAAEECAISLDHVEAMTTRAASQAWPIPWRAFEVFPPKCGKSDWNSVNSLNFLFARNNVVMENLPNTARVAAKRWWGTAQTYMAHPKVLNVFFSLSGDVAGGTIASDEQVMFVAAPIAVANGFDVDMLAVELWRRCPGWRKYQSALRGLSLMPGFADDTSFDYYWNDHYNEKGEPQIPLGKPRTLAQLAPELMKTPINAWWLQFGALSETCFEIVDEWNARNDRARFVATPDRLVKPVLVGL